METFTTPKELVQNPQFRVQRQKTLAVLRDEMIDGPIIGLINTYNRLPYCFTLQSCWGHFVYSGQSDPHNLQPLPAADTLDKVEYRIAYICWCVQNSESGVKLLAALGNVAEIDPQNIQFCSAEWFWDRQVNSYALQVQPDRFKHQDTSILGYREALRIERVRNRFFEALGKSLRELPAG